MPLVAIHARVPYELAPTSPVREWFVQNTGVTLLVSTPNKIGYGEWAVFQCYSWEPKPWHFSWLHPES